MDESHSSGENHNRTLSSNYESLDYDTIENVIFLEHQHKSRVNKFLNRDLQRWIAILLIAFATALSGFIASITVRELTHVKFTQIISATQDNCKQTNQHASSPLSISETFHCMWPSYLIWSLWNGIPVLFGSLLVTYIAPIAAGSGIPVVKCYLNGVKIPAVVHFQTYIAKLLGVISSVVGGLAAGKEGPFIHCGAALGAGLSQGKSPTLGIDTPLFKSFRNDREKRDFVSAGASAGVAAAFGAPMGGVLFALEEGASFWNQALTWRLFFCSMMTSFILNIFMVAIDHQAGILSFYSLANFGLVEELDYFWFEIPIYLTIAVLGGIVGASFCYFNLIISKFRKKYISSNWLKVLEAVMISILIASIGSLMIVLLPECRDHSSFNITHTHSISSNEHSKSDELKYSMIEYTPMMINYQANRNYTQLTYDPDHEINKALKNHVMTFMCPSGQFSAMSSLWLKTSEGASSTFMLLQDDIWSMQTLSIFMVVYYVLAVITYGLSVSSGVFIPSLLIGATGGRLIGLGLREIFGPRNWLNQLNKFALIGAASTLGGVVRMTISLTVIMIEATGCISFGLPIMLCLMVSKWIADSFIEGLYDIAIHMANVPFLDWEPPSKSHSIYASDVMSPNVKVLRTTETVANIISILKSNNHNGYPVVDFEENENSVSRHKNTTNPYAGDSNSPILADYYTPKESFEQQTSSHSNDTQNLIEKSINSTGATSTSNMNQFQNQNQQHLQIQLQNQQVVDFEDFLIGSFQRCSITTKRESHGRFRGLVLRWQLLIMLELRIFNENERSYENLNLEAFEKFYPRYPTLEEVISKLSDEMYSYHVDLRSVMNTAPHSVSYSSSLPRIYQLFRSLGLRHLVVIDDRNQVVGMITRKDLARYVKKSNKDGAVTFSELRYT